MKSTGGRQCQRKICGRSRRTGRPVEVMEEIGRKKHRRRKVVGSGLHSTEHVIQMSYEILAKRVLNSEEVNEMGRQTN